MPTNTHLRSADCGRCNGVCPPPRTEGVELPVCVTTFETAFGARPHPKWDRHTEQWDRNFQLWLAGWLAGKHNSG